jgi:hypothetical protein
MVAIYRVDAGEMFAGRRGLTSCRKKIAVTWLLSDW